MTSLRRLMSRAMVVAITGLVLIFSALAYWSCKSLLQDAVDRRLRAVATTLAAVVERPADLLPASDASEGRHTAPAGDADARQRLGETTDSVRLLTIDGRLASAGSEGRPRPSISSAVLERVRNGESVYETVYDGSAVAVRRLSTPIPAHPEPQYIVQAETSLESSQHALLGLIVLLGAVSAGAVGLAWIAGGWLAGRVLSPLNSLRATAEHISDVHAKSRFTIDRRYEELRDVTNAFNAMIERLHRSHESQAQFVDFAAHEMQTPLTVLQANLEVTLDKARSMEEYREALIANLEQVERLGKLSRELLTLARLSGERSPVRLVPLALQPLLEGLIAELRVLADDRDIELALETHAVPAVLGDERWLKQVFVNLLDNALRYTPRGGTVTVRLWTENRRVYVAVQDTGIGIARENLPHLFERFYRTDSARARDSGGTGLGLPIVQRIAEAHGGDVQVQSDVGMGSTFTLVLPVLVPEKVRR